MIPRRGYIRPDELAAAVLAADHTFGRELHQDEADCCASGVELLGELPFGWQASTWAELA